MGSRFAWAVALLLSTTGLAQAADPLHVYGPGGPLPAMNEIAEVYGRAHGIDGLVTAGPTPKSSSNT
jgi:accessory colonization factor AcfC